jgi:hypothetical protein
MYAVTRPKDKFFYHFQRTQQYCKCSGYWKSITRMFSKSNTLAVDYS